MLAAAVVWTGRGGFVRVGFDVTPRIAGATGVARYVAEVDAGLTATGDVTLTRYAIGRGRHEPPPHTRWLRIPLRTVHAAWRRGFGAPDLFLGDVDVLHATDLVPPPSRVPLVVTVHDLLALELPDLHPERAVRIQADTVRLLGRATLVLTPSEATADAVRRHVAGAEVLATPLAAFALPSPASGERPDGPVVLHVGGLVPRKDLVTAVRAIAASRRGAHLVLVGPDGPARERVVDEADRLGVRDRVHLVGRVDDEALAGWYAAAAVVITTTRGEGFGLPVLEALGAGVPVVASDLPVLREVGADAVTYVPVGEADGFGAAIDDLIDADSSHRMGDAGRERAAAFSWEATAQSTLRAYERAVTS